MKYIVDGNAFLNVAVNVVKNILSPDRRTEPDYYVEDLFNEGTYVLKEEARVEFKNFCINYFNSIIAPIGRSIDEVHFVFDSRSWRVDYIKDFFKVEEVVVAVEPGVETIVVDSSPKAFKYKGNRKADEKKFLFFEYFQREILTKLNDICGMNQYRLFGCEGDDIIAYLCEHLDGDLTVYTVDLDLKQLVDGDNRFVMLVMPKQMSKSKKLFTPYTHEVNVTESTDFFNLEESNISDAASPDLIIKKYCQKGYTDYKINPAEELMRKILGGDKSDQIPRLFKMTKGKVDKITAKLLDLYGDNFIQLIDSKDESLLDFMMEEMIVVNKIKDQVSIDELRRHLHFNIKIIRLSTMMFPEEIRNKLDEFFSTRTEFNKFSYDKFLKVKNNPVII